MKATKTSIVFCPTCRQPIYVLKGQERPTRCPHCGMNLEGRDD